MDNRLLARWTALVLFLAAATPLVVAAVVLSSLFSLPLPDDLPDPRPPEGSQISRVYDRNGSEIGVFREFELNTPVEMEDIPEHLKQAVIAVEDRNFYSHGGIDLRAIARALVADLRGGRIEQGGSTITQQYVKNAYVGNERTFGRKAREAILASQLDQKADKEQILFNYLQSIYLGEGAYGVGAAAETYFRKPVSELTLSESALLAGLIPAPSRFEPRANPGAAETRRKFVLDQMRAQGYISQSEHQSAKQERVFSAGQFEPRRPATVVFPAQSAVSDYPYFVDYLRRYLERTLGRDMVYRGGLEIRTTLDPAMQAFAEKAVTDSLAGTSAPLEMALVSVEPATGFVKTFVGGRDFNAPQGQVNLGLGKCHYPPSRVPRDNVDVPASCWDPDYVAVEGGGSGRQPGSSWKPFVLAAAFADGILDTKVYSAPGQYRIPNCRGDQCVVENFEGGGGGRASLRESTHKSYNTVYAQVIQEVGVPAVGEMARKLGISSAWVAEPEVHGVSYALGAQEVSPLDMASAYGVFATGGRRQEPTPVEWIKDPDGEFVVDNRERKPKRVLAEIIADNVTDVLRGVITSGTGTGADIGRPVAGKTGTSQEFGNAWFIGYVPELSTAVWIGDKTGNVPLRNVKGLERVTGGSIPAATWKAFMTEAVKDLPPSEFRTPVSLTATSTTSSTLFPPFEDTVPFFEDTTTTIPFEQTTTTSTTTTLPPTTTTTTRRGLLPLPL
jgi:penicillin-binding protein 1A